MLVGARNLAKERRKSTKGTSHKAFPKNHVRISAQHEEKQGRSRPPRTAPASSRASLRDDSRTAAPGACPRPAPLGGRNSWEGVSTTRSINSPPSLLQTWLAVLQSWHFSDEYGSK
ncbi:hypothetical protein DV515_00003128, partial [Chloebia gouldiae]